MWHLPASTLVAVVQWASTPQERRLLSTLATREASLPTLPMTIQAQSCA